MGRRAAIGTELPTLNDPVRLLVGDALTVLAMFPSATFHAIISDPPHGIGAGQWDVLPSLELLRDLLRVLRPGGKLVFIADDRTWHRLAVAVEDTGFAIEGHCLWLFATGRARTAAQPRPAFAPIIVARKPGPSAITSIDEARIPWRDDRDRRQACRAQTLRTTSRRRALGSNLDQNTFYTPNNEGRWPTSVLATDPVVGRLQHIFDIPKARDPNGHPCSKPIALMSQLLRLYSPPGGLVLDPFAGAGTTGVPAIAVGRRVVLVERDPIFARMAQTMLLSAQQGEARPIRGTDHAQGRRR